MSQHQAVEMMQQNLENPQENADALALPGEMDEKQKEEAEAAKLEKEMKKDAEEEVIPMMVFPWSYPPWRWCEFFSPMFLTFVMIVSSAQVFLCQYGYEGQVCLPMGILAFVGCLFALRQLQKMGTFKRQQEKLELEMNRLKDLMGRYEKENRALKETLGQLEQQAEVLKEETKTLGVFTQDLTDTTSTFEAGVRAFRQERKNLAKTFDDIILVVDSLNVNESQLKERCEVLRRELKKLRAHNRAIAETYNNLVEEHEGVQHTNKEMADQIVKFEEMRQRFLESRNVLKSTITTNLRGLNSMMDNYQLLFLQEIAHNTEFMTDGKPGMTPQKFEEFLRRIPAHMQVNEAKLVELFERLANDKIICDHEAMEKIIVQIVKANRGDPDAYRGKVSL